MKKLGFIFIYFISVFSAFSQYDPKAMEVLDAMSEKFRKLDAFKADIVYSLINETEDVNEEFKGEIFVKGNKYKLKTDEQEIINNGEIVWTYLPDVNEVNIDNFSTEEGDITPSSIYTMYKDGFKYLYLQESTVNGVLCDVIDLVPEDKDSQFFKIRMEISKSDRMLQRWTMFDKTGNRYIYSIQSFQSNISLNNEDFEFDSSNYKDVEIVDLR